VCPFVWVGGTCSIACGLLRSLKRKRPEAKEVNSDPYAYPSDAGETQEVDATSLACAAALTAVQLRFDDDDMPPPALPHRAARSLPAPLPQLPITLMPIVAPPAEPLMMTRPLHVPLSAEQVTSDQEAYGETQQVDATSLACAAALTAVQLRFVDGDMPPPVLPHRAARSLPVPLHKLPNTLMPNVAPPAEPLMMTAPVHVPPPAEQLLMTGPLRPFVPSRQHKKQLKAALKCAAVLKRRMASRRKRRAKRAAKRQKAASRAVTKNKKLEAAALLVFKKKKKHEEAALLVVKKKHDKAELLAFKTKLEKAELLASKNKLKNAAKKHKAVPLVSKTQEAALLGSTDAVEKPVL